VLAASLGTALALAACGGGGGSPTTTASAGPVDLTWFMWSGTPQEVTAWQTVAEMVTKQHPNIHVQFTTASFTDYWVKFQSEAASGTLPCLISLQSLRTGGFAPSFRSLTPMIQRDHFDVGAFDRSIIGGLTFDNGLRALPYDFGPYVIYYNRDLFDQNHVAPPAKDWTFQDFLSAARALTTGGKYGFMDWTTPEQFIPFVLSSGGSYLKNGKLDFTNPTVEKAFSDYVALATKEHVAPSLPATPNSTYARDQWLAGNAAMLVDGPWDVINFKANAKFRVGMTQFPRTGQKSVTVSAGSGFGISNTCQHPDEAWKALTVMTGPAAEQYLASAGRAFAARTAQQQYWYQVAGPDLQAPLQNALQTAVPYRTTAQWQQVSTVLQRYMVAAINGQMAPSDALSQVQSQAGG
jgi:ABC-type glycerol-3-phosphate transport system substrate-binding protein